MDLEPNNPKDKLSSSELFLKFIHESTYNYKPKLIKERIRNFHEFIQICRTYAICWNIA